jgi:RNA-directed DNA polymerase
MKRVGYLIEKIAEPENLRLAFWKARKGKPYSDKVEEYRQDLDSNLLKLRDQILSGEVEVGNYHYFKIYDPKERQICASGISERVLHHALMNICHNYFDKFQIYDSYASRPNKGVHASLERAKFFTQPNRWFLKLDVKKFFASIHHKVLKSQLERRFKDTRLLGIFDQIIDSYSSDSLRGLPIGNLASQYFANHYLAELDHFIKEELKCKYYVRYMDDMVIWHKDKDTLKNIKQDINHFIQTRLKCTLKPILLNRVERGVPFCGYIIRPDYVRLSQRSKKRYIKKINNIQKKSKTGKWTDAECQRKILPLIAFTRYADAKAFRQKVLFRDEA